MRTIDDVCCSCGTYGRAAMIATLGRARQLVLCPAYGGSPEAVRAFVARFNRARGGGGLARAAEGRDHGGPAATQPDGAQPGA